MADLNELKVGNRYQIADFPPTEVEFWGVRDGKALVINPQSNYYEWVDPKLVSEIEPSIREEIKSIRKWAEDCADLRVFCYDFPAIICRLNRVLERLDEC